MESSFELKREALKEAQESGKAVSVQLYDSREEKPYFSQIGIVTNVSSKMFTFKVYGGPKLLPIDMVIEVGYIGTSDWLYKE